LPVTEVIDPSSVPTQIVEEMILDQSKGGRLSMRVYAPLMESYSKKIPPYDIFPNGMNIKAFTPDGLLETEITAKVARHIKGKSQDKWEAYGDVVITTISKRGRQLKPTLFTGTEQKEDFYSLLCTG
jgi:hypothetical protein